MTNQSDVSNLIIRGERAEDRDAIARVVAAAFGSPAEAQLVAAIRASDNFVVDWSLVAELDGSVIGHVMVSFVCLRDGDEARSIPSLSPLAVAPEVHRHGIGSALVHAVVERVDASGQPLVVLEGDPRFYGRLGFEPSVGFGIHITLPEWAPPEAAQIRRLDAYDPSIRGTVEYPPAFDPFVGH